MSSASPHPRPASLREQIELERGMRIVCVVTGHELKDTETAGRLGSRPVAVDPDPDAILEATR